MIKLPKKFKSSNILTTAIALITLIIGFFGGSYYNQQKQSQLPTSGIVTRIIDADNIELDNNRSIRLYAVSCPEKDQKLSDETIAYLKDKALNQKVTLDYQPNYTKDKWDRFLAYAFIGDTHLNEQLVRQGFCEVTIYQKRAKLKYQDELLKAQEEAKTDKLGKWQ